MKQFKNLLFYFVNFVIAAGLVAVIGYFVLNGLSNYTRHGEMIDVPTFYRLTQDQAHELAIKNKLNTIIQDSIYNKNEAPGVILDQYPEPGSQVKANRKIRLVINTMSPEKVVFPQLINSAYRQSVQTIEGLGMRVGRITYQPSSFKNLVIGFSYNGIPVFAGDKIPKGAIVDIVLGAGSGTNTVRMPRLTGLTYNKAQQLIRQTFLNTDSLFMDETINIKEGYDNSFVYKQEPKIDSVITAGSGVKLYLTNSKKVLEALDTLQIINK